MTAGADLSMDGGSDNEGKDRNTKHECGSKQKYMGKVEAPQKGVCPVAAEDARCLLS